MVLIGAEAIATTLLSGIVLGSLYTLMAIGLTLIFSTVRVVNFAHGSFLALGAFIAWWLSAPSYTQFLGPEPHSLGLEAPFVIAFAASIVVMFGFGLFYERTIIRPVRMKPDWEMKFYFITISLLVAFENFNIFAFGATNKAIPLGIKGTLYFDGFPIFSHMEIMQLSVAVATIALIFLFLKFHKHGLAMRAVMFDTEMSTLLGIRLTRIFSLTFGLSAVLAGIAGVLVSNIFLVRFDMGTLPLLKGFMIMIFGGLGSLPGTLIAAFIIGEIEALTALYLGINWALPVEFAIIALFLIFRQRGLLGVKE